VEALLAILIKYVVPAVMSWLTGWISAKLHTEAQKNAAAKSDQGAIDNAEKNNDTSGLFNG
jgi:hypothetical protein